MGGLPSSVIPQGLARRISPLWRLRTSIVGLVYKTVRRDDLLDTEVGIWLDHIVPENMQPPHFCAPYKVPSMWYQIHGS